MQPTLRTRAACLPALLLWAASAAQAAQSPASLVEAARSAALQAARDSGVNNPTAIVGAPDPRLRLVDCPTPLAAGLTGPTRLPGRAVVRVACPGAPGWSVHLPVQVQASGAVLVAARPLPRGHRLQAGDLRRQTAELGALGGQYLLDDGAAVGQALRRSVGAGERLTPALLQSPLLVRRGDPVTLQIHSARFVIRASGKALRSGAAGERIAVENPSSRRVVYGTVTGDGQVTVEF
ncbi:flagellar basal body P-ring formation chaperone FlgA [Immundisolibacter sp.]|uniref:flagellar basal body P-ring formation chaperone FlgA n=1 Tax=Immundisolibacter sp. TaxID=1934948 RepID=UPI0026167A3C|nr:flagellar basal body P-ring formation chaperone FlgA [Immundisolibacter sp.]MDD3650842.1 flagellar basal body P-ring formation chaperone FlgA [Immundisolibacter sp.]